MLGNLTLLGGLNLNTPYTMPGYAHILDSQNNGSPLGQINAHDWRWVLQDKTLQGGIVSNSGTGAVYALLNNFKTIETTLDNYFLYQDGLYGNHIPFGCPANAGYGQYTYFIVAICNMPTISTDKYLIRFMYYNGAYVDNTSMVRLNGTDYLTVKLSDLGTNTITLSSNISTQTLNIYCIQFNNLTGRLDFWVNGNNFNSTNSLMTNHVFIKPYVNNSNTGNNFWANTNGSGNGFLGYVADSYFYNSLLSTTNINIVGKFLQQKFNTQTWTNI